MWVRVILSISVKDETIYELVGGREAILATLLGELEFHLLISSSSYD